MNRTQKELPVIVTLALVGAFTLEILIISYLCAKGYYAWVAVLIWFEVFIGNAIAFGTWRSKRIQTCEVVVSRALSDKYYIGEYFVNGKVYEVAIKTSSIISGRDVIRRGRTLIFSEMRVGWSFDITVDPMFPRHICSVK